MLKECIKIILPLDSIFQPRIEENLLILRRISLKLKEEYFNKMMISWQFNSMKTKLVAPLNTFRMTTMRLHIFSPYQAMMQYLWNE